MKKLLLLLFLIPNLLMAETWHCSYKSTEGPAEDTESFKREGKFFVSKGKFDESNDMSNVQENCKNSQYLICPLNCLGVN